MAFPASETPFVQVGPAGDTRGISQVLPGEDITEVVCEAVLTNSQRAWTCAHRVAYEVPHYASSTVTFAEAARIPLERVEDRDGWKVYLDKEDCEVRASLRKQSDDTLVGIALTTSDGLIRAAPSVIAFTTTEILSVDLYLLIEVQQVSGAAGDGVLYGGTVIEDAASL